MAEPIETTEKANSHLSFKLPMHIAGLGLSVALSTLSPVLALPLAVIEAVNVDKYLPNRKPIDNSLFLSHGNKIVMTFGNANSLVSALLNKNKEEELNIQLFNLFAQLDRTNTKSNEKIKYTTLTHPLIIRKLTKLQSMGYIENLTKTRSETKRKMLLETLMLGNTDRLKKELKSIKIKGVNKSYKVYNKLFNKNKEEIKVPCTSRVQIYDVTFNFTDKKIDKGSLKDFFGENFPENVEIITNKDGSVKCLKRSIGKDLVKKFLPQQEATPLLVAGNGSIGNITQAHDEYCKRLRNPDQRQNRNLGHEEFYTRHDRGRVGNLDRE